MSTTPKFSNMPNPCPQPLNFPHWYMHVSTVFTWFSNGTTDKKPTIKQPKTSLQPLRGEKSQRVRSCHRCVVLPAQKKTINIKQRTWKQKKQTNKKEPTPKKRKHKKKQMQMTQPNGACYMFCVFLLCFFVGEFYPKTWKITAKVGLQRAN